jgi:hypothetical protein
VAVLGKSPAVLCVYDSPNITDDLTLRYVLNITHVFHVEKRKDGGGGGLSDFGHDCTRITPIFA